MQLKTFSAQSSAAVLAKIKAEFGTEAVILETREEDGQVYITAALERNSASSARAGQAAPGQEPDAGPDPAGSSPDAPPFQGEAALRKKAWNAYHSPDALREPGIDAPPPDQPGGTRWEHEWDNIKAHLLALMKPALRLDRLPPRQRLALEYLQREGVEDEAVLKLYEYLRDAPNVNILVPLSKLVPVRPWDEKNWPQRTQLITGPFGAGKSSVSIRMALSLRKSSPDCRICLVNADATRGNGRLLLRHYSELSDFAYKEASSTLELVGALNAAKREGYDRILVDMPGLGRDAFLQPLLDDAGLGDLCGEGAEDAAVHLALPPHYSTLELRAILERYATLHAGSLVWTKLDEAGHYGQIVNVGAATGLPVSALSYGPGLGNSLAPARASMLWRLLFKRELPTTA